MVFEFFIVILIGFVSTIAIRYCSLVTQLLTKCNWSYQIVNGWTSDVWQVFLGDAVTMAVAHRYGNGHQVIEPSRHLATFARWRLGYHLLGVSLANLTKKVFGFVYPTFVFRAVFACIGLRAGIKLF